MVKFAKATSISRASKKNLEAVGIDPDLFRAVILKRLNRMWYFDVELTDDGLFYVRHHDDRFPSGPKLVELVTEVMAYIKSAVGVGA